MAWRGRTSAEVEGALDDGVLHGCGSGRRSISLSSSLLFSCDEERGGEGRGRRWETTSPVAAAVGERPAARWEVVGGGGDAGGEEG